jgi:riboflavin synthase
LRADGRLDGHFVTGHIDGIGKISRWERAGADHVLEIAPPADLLRYIVQKGSIAVDGISLTVAEAGEKSFRVWIIPHTYQVTAMRERKAGDAVNLETDILGKYVERLLRGK